MSDAFLRGADLTGADLIETRLTGARLPNASLTSANLFSADLSGADLLHANLLNALPRRFDTGRVRVSGRDFAGLMLCGEMYGAPYDLLAAYLNVQPDRLRGIAARWRAAGYAETGQLGPGPAWCWLIRPGLAALGLRFAAGRPSLERLAHLRAVLAARLALESSPAGQAGQPWWRSERRIRAAAGGRVAGGHIPDAEACWAEIPGSPYPGERWAIEVELTPKPSPAQRPSWPACCTAAPATPPGRSHTTARVMTAPSTSSAPQPAASSPAPSPHCPHHYRRG